MVLSIEQGIVLEFHPLETFGVEAHKANDMGRELGIGIKPPILL
jgi:hypothetical protein